MNVEMDCKSPKVTYFGNPEDQWPHPWQRCHHGRQWKLLIILICYRRIWWFWCLSWILHLESKSFLNPDIVLTHCFTSKGPRPHFSFHLHSLAAVELRFCSQCTLDLAEMRKLQLQVRVGIWQQVTASAGFLCAQQAVSVSFCFMNAKLCKYGIWDIPRSQPCNRNLIPGLEHFGRMQLTIWDQPNCWP